MRDCIFAAPLVRWVSGLNHQFAKLTNGAIGKGNVDFHFERIAKIRKGMEYLCGIAIEIQEIGGRV